MAYFGFNPNKSSLYQGVLSSLVVVSLPSWSLLTDSPGPAGPQPRLSLAPYIWPVRQRDQHELREWALGVLVCTASA